MENINRTGNINIDAADIDVDGPLLKNRKRSKLSPAGVRTQNENKYQMADGHEILSSMDTMSTTIHHKYVTTCESFLEEVENGFITNSIQNVLTDPNEQLVDQCSSSKSMALPPPPQADDLKYENIELYTHFEPQEGRPILNTSMIRFSNQSKGRRPLATVVGNNQNSIQHHYPNVINNNNNNSSSSASQPKKCHQPTISNDESFYCYQRKVPHVGGGVDHFARLSYEMIASPIFTDDEIKSMSFPKLQYLDLCMASITPQSLVELFAKCVNLKKLSLESVPIDTAVCAGIGRNRHLEALHLTMCTGVDKFGIANLLRELKSLENLNISWTSMSTECIDAFIERVPKCLLRLNIAGCRKSLTDNHIADLSKRCPNLIELDISDCVNLTSVCIEYMRKFKNLEFLSMSRCYNISPASYVTLNETLQLLYLDIFGVLSDEAITLIQNKFPSVGINKFIHSAVARPTVGTRRTSVWGLRTRDG